MELSGDNQTNEDPRVKKFMDGFRLQREDLEEAILDGEEKLEALEDLEEEILKRATVVEEQVTSLKEFIAANLHSAVKPELLLKNESAFDACFVVDMLRLREALDAEKERLTNILEEKKQAQQKVTQSYNSFLIERQNIAMSQEFKQDNAGVKQNMLDLFVENQSKLLAELGTLF